MRVLPSLLVAAVMTASTATVAAEQPLTIARLFADPALSGAAPRALKVSPDGERVTFLRGRPDAQERLDLWEFNVASGKTRVLVDSALLAPAAGKLSAEEEARRERARLAGLSGIIEYDFAPDGKRLLFPLNGALYVYDLSKSGAKAVTQITEADDGFATDAKISPRGRFASFVRDQEVWVYDFASKQSYAVTGGAGGSVSNGVAEFVAQEEMDRSTGYWWAPDDSKIAYARIDESKVPVQRRFEIQADRVDVVEQRYPAAGDPNVAISLHYVVLDELKDAKKPTAESMEPGESFSIDPDTGRALVSHRVDLGEEADIYLARVDWVDADRLAFQRQSRDQRTLDLVLVDLEDDGAQKTLLTETSKTWINLHDDFRPLSRSDGFLWSSERSGLRQLYAYDYDGTLVREVSRAAWPIEEVLAVDERAGVVYAAAPGADPLEKHVYAYPLSGKGEPKRVTKAGGWHQVAFAGDASVFVDTWSDPSTPPSVALHRANGERVTVLEPNALGAAHPYGAFAATHRAPTYGTLKSKDGQDLYYGVITPPNFDASKKYPVIVRYYGGPGRQFVTKAWTVGVNTGLTDTLSQYWASRGYVVFALDNRGTPRRGKYFEDALFRQMGDDEVDDQLAGLDWLAAQPWVDAKRVGVFGWSYGGFQTLMLLGRASDRIAAGVAVAPVTDWRLYDTHYTERFLDRPAANAEGYEASSVFPYIESMKSPLLLMHGMADDNVLFTNTTRLMAELQARAVPFDLMTYPGGKHGLVGAQVRTHVYSTIDTFFDRHLQP